MTLRLRIITPQRLVLDDRDVAVVIAPGTEGELSILPRHAPLFTRLDSGLVTYRVGVKKHYVGLEEAFMNVAKNTVTILADSAILPEEADRRRAEESRKKAEEAMRERLEGTDFKKVEAEMRKALLELKLIEHIK